MEKIKRSHERSGENDNSSLVHAWEIKDLSVVLLDEEFRKKLIGRIMQRFSWNKRGNIKAMEKYYAEKLGISFWTVEGFFSFLRNRFPQKLTYPKISYLVKIAEDNSISKYELEKAIKRVRRNRGYIYDVQFPIKTNEILVSTLFHIQGDGCRKSWSQKKELHDLNRTCFINKISSIIYSKRWVENARKSKRIDITFPTILRDILQSAFRMTWKEICTRKFPRLLHSLPRFHKVSALTSIIIDEGSISKYDITIGMNNQEIVKELHRLCTDLGYDVGNVTRGSGEWIFRIRVDGACKFYRDLQELTEKYGDMMDLGDKQKNLEELIEGRKRLISKFNEDKGKRRKLMLLDLKLIQALRGSNIELKKAAERIGCSYSHVKRAAAFLRNIGLIEAKHVNIPCGRFIHGVTKKGKLFSSVCKKIDESLLKTLLGSTRAHSHRSVARTLLWLKNHNNDLIKTSDVIASRIMPRTTVYRAFKILEKNGVVQLTTEQPKRYVINAEHAIFHLIKLLENENLLNLW